MGKDPIARQFDGRRRLARLLACAVLLIAPAMSSSAHAASVSAAGGFVVYTGGNNETNDVRVSFSGVSGSGNEFDVVETGAPLSAGPGCSGVSGGQATCVTTGLVFMVVDAGNMDDTVTVSGPGLINGGGGNDTLRSSSLGGVAMLGGPGTDTADYSTRHSPVTVSLDGVFNDGEAGHSPDSVDANVENIIGGSGDDTFSGPAGVANSFDGGPGSDTVSYAARGAPVAVDLAAPGDQGEFAENDQFASIENARGGSGNDSLTGDSRDNTLDGAPGDDSLDGGLGADELDGGLGTDTVSYADRNADLVISLDGASGDGEAGEGDNVASAVEDVVGGWGNDTLTGANNVANKLEGGPGNDTLDGRSGPDVLIGGPGSDSADYSDRTGAVAVTPGSGPGDGEAGERDDVNADVESIKGGSGNDTLTGTGADNRLDGGPGDDTLDGGLGSDVLVGGPGRDSASYTTRSAPVSVDLSSPGGDGEPGEADDVQTENVVGGAGDDVLIGDGGANTLIAGPGNDALSGAGGADVLLGEAGDDSLTGGEGNDGLYGGAGNDSMAGGGGDDALNGDDGDDTLDGGPGADTFNGGSGTDTATYASRSAPLNLTLDGSPNDGQAGEQDNLRDDVENLIAGSGDDSIDVATQSRNVVDCGSGTDTIHAERIDVLSNCERVAIDSPVLVINTSTAKLSRAGKLAMSLRCQGKGEACTGTLTLRRGKARGGKRKPKKRRLTLGSESFSIAAGKTQDVAVKLSRKGRRALARAGRSKIQAIASAKAQLSSFKATTKTITVSAATQKKKKSKKGGGRR